ncbi:hypothetical protein ABT381_10440 [Streptomyces sp. NPDC000151]|uniref:hypothetical protein n=1 Tax=Streptomyces sp. NPDC000151 TaxID=3154244 RepID=UPI00332DC606
MDMDRIHECPQPPDAVAHDCRWAAGLRDACLCAATLLGLLLLLDGGTGRLTPPRAVLWAGLAALLFAVLLPPRVSAGPGWLAVHGLLGERRVRTDLLVSVRRLDGVAQRLVLRDMRGGRVEIDPAVLTGDPALWRFVAAGARTSAERGLLLCGTVAMRQLARHVDSETARLVFKVSGLR